MSSKWQYKQAQWLGGELQIILNSLIFLKLQKSQWNNLLDFFDCIKLCLTRPMPKSDSDVNTFLDEDKKKKKKRPSSTHEELKKNHKRSLSSSAANVSLISSQQE